MLLRLRVAPALLGLDRVVAASISSSRTIRSFSSRSWRRAVCHRVLLGEQRRDLLEGHAELAVAEDRMQALKLSRLIAAAVALAAL